MPVVPVFHAVHVSYQSAAVTIVYFHKRLSSVTPSHVHILNNLPASFSPREDEYDCGAGSRETTHKRTSLGLIAGFLARVARFERQCKEAALPSNFL